MPSSPEKYLGIHIKDFVSEETRRKAWKKKTKNKIFLYHPRIYKNDPDGKKAKQEYEELQFQQIVHVYTHTMDDIEFNTKRMIQHYKKYIGKAPLWYYTIGQYIKFVVYPEQKEPFELPLYFFMVNYSMLTILIECGADLHDWKPWTPRYFSTDKWMAQINKYIRRVRANVNMRKLCECIELGKYLMNMMIVDIGDRIGLSIDNLDFIECMKRSEEARKSITCTFDIPKDIDPADLEDLTMKRTKDLLDFISKQSDLSISHYARNGLFNRTQFREYAVHITHKPNLSGATIPYTYPTNIIMGIKDPRAFMVDAAGGRKAEILKLNVSDAGTLERSLMMLMSPVKKVDINWECDSKHYRKRYISSASDLEKLEGRVIKVNEDPEDDQFYIIDTTDTDLIGKTVFMKTPITCTHPRRAEGYICSACYGKLLAPLNRDIHIGRSAAADSAAEIEQKLLSAKHALQTNTNRVEFLDNFREFFDMGNGSIKLAQQIIDASTVPDSDVDHLFLEFRPHLMRKNLDGESRHLDRSFDEIVIYDDRDDTRITIVEQNGAPLYLSPEFNNNCFLPRLRYHEGTDPILVPFTELVDTGEVQIDTLFEFTYKNNEIASPLLKLESIMFNCETIGEFSSYDECLDTLIPLFIEGGIRIPDYQTELLVSQLIIGTDGKRVDWNDPTPEYTFISINKSIQRFDSALTSVLYRESGMQIAGAHNTYQKKGTSDYDPFIISDKSIWS